jgi:hypothetical protein
MSTTRVAKALFDDMRYRVGSYGLTVDQEIVSVSDKERVVTLLGLQKSLPTSNELQGLHDALQEVKYDEVTNDPVVVGSPDFQYAKENKLMSRSKGSWGVLWEKMRGHGNVWSGKYSEFFVLYDPEVGKAELVEALRKKSRDELLKKCKRWVTQHRNRYSDTERVEKERDEFKALLARYGQVKDGNKNIRNEMFWVVKFPVGGALVDVIVYRKDRTPSTKLDSLQFRMRWDRKSLHALLVRERVDELDYYNNEVVVPPDLRQMKVPLGATEAAVTKMFDTVKAHATKSLDKMMLLDEEKEVFEQTATGTRIPFVNSSEQVIKEIRWIKPCSLQARRGRVYIKEGGPLWWVNADIGKRTVWFVLDGDKYAPVARGHSGGKYHVTSTLTQAHDDRATLDERFTTADLALVKEKLGLGKPETRA